MTSLLGSITHTFTLVRKVIVQISLSFFDAFGSNGLEIFAVCLSPTVWNYLYGNLGETIHLEEPISTALKRYGGLGQDGVPIFSIIHRPSEPFKSTQPCLLLHSLLIWRREDGDEMRRTSPYSGRQMEPREGSFERILQPQLKAGAAPAAQRAEFHS